MFGFGRGVVGWGVGSVVVQRMRMHARLRRELGRRLNFYDVVGFGPFGVCLIEN